MTIREQIPLKKYNTFSIDVMARFFAEASSIEDLRYYLAYSKKNKLPILVLGGGSNILLTKNFDGLVIKLNLKGRKIIHTDTNKALVEANAGEIWHEFVLWTLDKGLGGLENLSLIPGNVGTAPIQNIGAYGVEVKETISEVKALDINSGEIHTFSNKECDFGYRDSIFKKELKDKYIIVSVIFELTSKKHHLRTSYGDIQAELNDKKIDNPTILDISNAIVKIRSSKLPDPNKIGNSGSFFKNPTIEIKQYEKLKENFPQLVAYPVNNKMKLATAWLIEKAGWKGKRIGDAGVHTDQALVLVNYGKATGSEIFDLSYKIQKDVFQKFGIEIEREVNVI